VDGDLDAVCRRALAPRKDRRYATPESFADDLEAWLARRPIAWTEPGVERVAALWVKRRPLAASGLALSIAALGGVGWIAAQWNAQMIEREREAARIEAQAVIRQSNWEQGRKSLGTLLGYANAALGKDKTYGVAPWIWKIEWMAGPQVFGDEAVLEEIQKSRIVFLQKVVERNRAMHGGTSLDVALWETALVYWLALEDRDAEALELIRERRNEWLAVVPEGDPWRVRIDGLRAISEAGVILATPPADRTNAQRDELSSLEASLRAFVETPRDPAGDNLTQLAQSRLAAIEAERGGATPDAPATQTQ